MIKISPELLSKILGKKVYWSEEALMRKGSITVHYDRERYLSDTETFNIYLLAHKAKEWAWDKGFTLQIMWVIEDKKLCVDIAIWDKVTLLQKYQVPITYKDTEPEAILRAAQWVLDND